MSKGSHIEQGRIRILRQKPQADAFLPNVRNAEPDKIIFMAKFHPTPAVSTIEFRRKLEEQLKETQVAKDELVAQQQELHEMMIRFKID